MTAEFPNRGTKMNGATGGRWSRGIATVEIALLLPLFLLLLFAITDFARLMFTMMTLQHAMREGGRFAVTGERLPDPDHADTLLSRVESIRRIVRQKAVGVPLDPNDIVIASILGGDGSAGGPGDTVTLSLTYTYYFVTPMLDQYFNGGTHEFTVSTSFRNEPFPPGAEQ